MVLTNAERQARHRDRQREREAYERHLRDQQIAAIEGALNEVRSKVGLAEIQLPKLAD